MTPRYTRLIFPRSSRRNPPPRKIYQFHKGDFVGLKASLTTLSSDYLSTNPECNTVDENWSYISQKILEATDNFVPHKMSKGKRHLPWVSSSVKRLMNKRNRAYKKACRSGKAVHLTKYKRLRNITTMPALAVQGRVTTLRSGFHPLLSTLTNTLSMWDQSLRGTRYQLMLLVRHLTQNLPEECPLL